MTHAPTLPPSLADLCPHWPPGPARADTAEPPGAGGLSPLRCVQSRLAKPPVVQLVSMPSPLNRRLQRSCIDLQQRVTATRRLALQQANRDLIHQTMPGDHSLQRLHSAQTAWLKQWAELMEYLATLEAGLPADAPGTEAERDQDTLVDARRLIDAVRIWALGFRTDIDLELDTRSAHGQDTAGGTGNCQ